MPSGAASPWTSGPTSVPPGEFEPVAPATGAARSRLGLSVGAVGVVLLLVMGLVVVRGLQGQSTGADNPDDLVTLLQSAITKTVTAVLRSAPTASALWNAGPRDRRRPQRD